jgi:riboflavin kinase/FMN adenylyltransferase
VPVEEMTLLPADGVYEVVAFLGDVQCEGVMNIGVKPTIGGNRLRTIEVHLLDFSADIYGKRMRVELVRRLRGEQLFDSMDALRAQIDADVARVRNKN